MSAPDWTDLGSVRRAALSGWFGRRPPAGARILLTLPVGDGFRGGRVIVVHTHD